MKSTVKALFHQPVSSLLLQVFESNFGDMVNVDRRKALGILFLVSCIQLTGVETLSCQGNTAIVPQ